MKNCWELRVAVDKIVRIVQKEKIGLLESFWERLRVMKKKKRQTANIRLCYTSSLPNTRLRNPGLYYKLDKIRMIRTSLFWTPDK